MFWWTLGAVNTYYLLNGLFNSWSIGTISLSSACVAICLIRLNELQKKNNNN